MAGVATTQLTVEFDPAAFSRDGSVVLERSNRQPEQENFVYFRAHGAKLHSIRSTSGTVFRAQTGLRRFTSEFLSFMNTSTVQLRYPEAEGVTAQRIGVVYDADGQIKSSPKFRYDAAKHAMVSDSGPVTGILLVEYKAPYDLWRATFSGVCPSVDVVAPPIDTSRGNPDDDAEYVGREPMLVTAWKGAALDASLQLTPPDCNYDDEAYSGRRIMGTEPDILVVEVDPNDPVRLVSAGFTTNILSGGCGLRVYPGDSDITIGVSSGDLKADKSVILERVEREVIQFSGNSTQRLTYPPKNTNISVKQVSGNFVDVWGREFQPRFAKWGDSITAVEWQGKGTYTNPVRRKADRCEIAVGNLFGNAVPCYGFAEVTYVTSYWLADLEFEFDEERQVFNVATIVVYNDDEAASLTLEGPSTEGDY